MNNKLSNKNILVLGGSGFVGSNLLKKITKLTNKITATYHSNEPKYNNEHINWVKINLTKDSQYKKLMKDKEIVFICAAYTKGASVIVNSPMDLVTPNIIMNSNILENCYKFGVKKVIFLSSSVVYPEMDIRIDESLALTGNPPEIYFPVAWMKRYTEILCQTYSKKIKHGFSSLIIRPSNLYGPYDNFHPKESHVIPSLIRRVVNKETPFKIWGTGEDSRDFIYIDDFIEGVINATNIDEQFMDINLTTAQNKTINQILENLFEIENYYPDVEYDTTQPQTINQRLLSNEKAKKLINFKLNTPIKEGLENTLKWYKENEL